ncbi:MAG TPA: fibronectin type III domain-containing protein [Blastocatellia bacterium]|nr:fibronectin type III domain-containing protein [Blastocatellia bacterium]
MSPLLPVFFIACGKIGDPLPPIPRAPLIVDELSVEQQGTKLILSFPFIRTSRTRLQRVDVYRMIEPSDAPPGLAIETFSEKAHVVHSIPAAEIPLNNSKIIYNDGLDMRSELRNKRYRYAVRMFNSAGQPADFSNYATIEPLFNLSLPPAGLKIKQFETQIEITWNRPSENMNETSPANVAGYNIYRRAGDSVSRINPEPLSEPRFIDRNFQFGASYQYIVRSLSFTPGKASLSEAIESNDSQPYDHTPKDTFPPTAPEKVTIASINSMVSIFWPLNAEPDVVGYNIYRAEDENTPPEKWIKLNQELHKTASFRDQRVLVGKKYFYQIAAVDVYGNESPRSETVSETVAP